MPLPLSQGESPCVGFPGIPGAYQTDLVVKETLILPTLAHYCLDNQDRHVPARCRVSFVHIVIPVRSLTQS